MQNTLRDVAIITGIGVFTGREITVEMHPAPPDSGTCFELVSEGVSRKIKVAVENILDTENRTVLADPDNQSVQVNFVEHILGAMHGMGVDNATIRIDSIELPLIDGSALPYLQAIDKVGLVEQDAERHELVISKPLFIDDGALLLALPHDGLRLTYYLDQPEDAVGKRAAQIDVNPENFRKRIGPARTFVQVGKVADLLASGAVKHQDKNQILIVDRRGTSQPLRFADEFCYHKMLDILGDLFLTGRRIRGHIVGIRSGHYQNRKMIRKLAEVFIS
jgi:UDP-3-O-[3-hydroxymyristoyl] N-acetylglucosamine deacetylase/3-hydroxyacyl-[acyl-carrier-protein] dehydratase